MYATVIVFAAFDLRAQPSVDVELRFLSNSIDRGQDLNADRARQQNRSYGAHTGAWTAQPEIIFHSGFGLYAGGFLSFAMEGREDEDIDQVFQDRPGGPDLFLDGTALNTAIANVQPIPPADCNNGGCRPQYFDEEVGLQRQDLFVPVIGYEGESDYGTFGFGLEGNLLILPSVESDRTAIDVFFSYAPPVLSFLYFEAYVNIDSASQYLSLGGAHEWDLAEDHSMRRRRGRQLSD